MKPWEEIKEKFSYWSHPMWQWATTDSKCVNCDIYGHETAQEFLVYVEGEGDKQYCKMCYFSKFVDDDDYDIEELHADDLPPEVMTDGRGNTTLDNWEH